MDIQEAAVYVGTYGKYNNGNLGGGWLYISDYPTKADFVRAAKKLHNDESYPEFMYQDWQNIPNGMISESSISEELFEVVRELNTMDPEQIEAFYVFCDLYKYNLEGKDATEILEIFNDSYYGDFPFERDFAYYIVEEFGFPENQEEYFDYDGYARSLLMSGYDYYDGHVFRTPY